MDCATPMDTRIAYLLLVHDDPPMAVRLCSQLLRDPSADIYLHVDKKSSLCFSGCISLDSARVHAVDERYVVSWAGFNMVLATLSLPRPALAAPHNYSYLVLLSGHDYPLRSPTEINRYFHEAHYRQHINRISILDSPDFYAAHITRYHFRDQWIRPRLLDKILRRLATSLMLPLRRRLQTSVMPCHGSQWWALTANCAEYLLAAIDADPDFSRPYRHSFVPDEHFFHTLVQNSPYVVEAPPHHAV